MMADLDTRGKNSPAITNGFLIQNFEYGQSL